MPRRGVQTGAFNLPRKGTKRREQLLLMLRPCGMSYSESPHTNSAATASTIRHFTDRLDFDVIEWRGDDGTKRFRIIGRWRDDGKYLDYLARSIVDL